MLLLDMSSALDTSKSIKRLPGIDTSTDNGDAKKEPSEDSDEDETVEEEEYFQTWLYLKWRPLKE